MDEERNEITGLIGSKMDSLLRRKSSERACKLIGIGGVGFQIDPNSQTFSGALGLLQANRGDLILRPLSRHLQRPWLMHSHATSQVA